jgi:hypothetical protein
MNSMISNAQIGTFKRIKMQYIAAAGSVALAAAAIVGAVTLGSEGREATSRSIVPVSDIQAGGFPTVQEMSHPQVAPLVEASTSDIQAGGFPAVQELSHPVAPEASWATSDVRTGSFPLVQEMSHPQVEPALVLPPEVAVDYSLPTTFIAEQSLGQAEADNASYPLVQELSAPVPAAETRQLTAEEFQYGSFPSVQELSAPVPAASPSDSTTDVGSYPLVQEMSHPQVEPALVLPPEVAVDYSVPTTFAEDLR